MTAVEVLRKAREVLVTRGWYQGDYYADRDKRGRWISAEKAPRCMVGACRAASYIGDGLFDYDAYSAAHTMLLAELGETPSVWNDAPVRTLNEVLAAFDKAIAAEEARVQP